MKLKKLTPGSTVCLVAPSGPLGHLKVDGLEFLLASFGFRTRRAEHLLDQWRYLAGSDEARAHDLQRAFEDPEVDAVFCARGGYGCARLLPYLDLDLIAQSRKLFIGFSDITVLHLALNRRGLPTLHGPMAHAAVQDHSVWVNDSLRSALYGDALIPEEAPAGECAVPGSAEGIVIGGCLTLLADACGTPDQPDTADKIVLIEDVGEQAYRIDARLTQLLNSGVLQNAAGFVIGEMTGTNEKEDEPSKRTTWQEVVMDRLGPLGRPIIFNFPFGHITSPLTLPLGIRARMDASAGRLQYLERICE